MQSGCSKNTEMKTATRSNPFPLLLALLGIGLFLAVQATPHVVLKRGTEKAAALENCFNGQGQYMATAYNPETGRYCDVYLDENEKFNLHITENGETVTMIVKEKFTNFGQLLKYFENSFYELVLRIF